MSEPLRQRVAVVGAGISGMLAARRLCARHEVTLFESNDCLGGHTNTLNVEVDGLEHAVDTGFVVFNDWTYPHFIALMDELGVASQPSTMSFSVRCDRSGTEWQGSSLNGLFAQRRNIARPSFWRMLRDVARFNREAPELLSDEDWSTTLGDYLERGRYSDAFVQHYLIPMGAAIWSSRPEDMREFPARCFVEFFRNHGLLNLVLRPQWRVISGGSRAYVGPLTAPYAERIRLATPVARVQRHATHVDLTLGDGSRERFDALVLACHSDQALRLLADPSAEEQGILGSIPYQRNDVVLHTDTTLLPRRRRAWAAWNYHLPSAATSGVQVTYNMNILQSLDTSETLCVTLNRSHDIDPRKIIAQLEYDHPVYTAQGLRAQSRREDINGGRRTYYCGAYWGYGFHEDGAASALAACEAFERDLASGKLSVRRAG